MNTHRQIKESAVNKFLKIIYYNNPSLGKELYGKRVYIFDQIIENVQKIGITDYAKKCLEAKALA